MKQISSSYYTFILNVLNSVTHEIDGEEKLVDSLLSSDNIEFNKLFELYIKYAVDYPARFSSLLKVSLDNDLKDLFNRDNRLNDVANRARGILKKRFNSEFTRSLAAL